MPLFYDYIVISKMNKNKNQFLTPEFFFLFHIQFCKLSWRKDYNSIVFVIDVIIDLLSLKWDNLLFCYLHICNRIVVGIYNYLCNQCLSQRMLRRGILNTTLCDKVCQWYATGRWPTLGTPVSSTHKSDRHGIAEILLKVVLNTITLTLHICNKSCNRQSP